MSQGLDVCLLGPTTVRYPDRSVDISGAPQRTVLARLALDPGRPVSDAVLIDSLWPGGPPANANGNLQSYVSRLRAQLGGPAIPRRPNGYLLDTGPECVDVHRFERLVVEARTAADAPRRVARFHQALDMWSGEPFADVVDPAVFEPQRVRLDGLRALALEGWLTGRVDCGDVEGVLPELEGAVAHDPSGEGLQLLLARVLHLLGRTAEALRVIADHRVRLVEESGLDPGPAVVEMEQRILGDADALRPQTPAPPRSGPHTRPRRAPPDRFVGRSKELQQLSSALDEHRIVTIVGPGGCGKTRLAQEVTDGHEGPAPPFVELGALSPGEAIDTALARALGLQAAPAGVETAVYDALPGGASLLVLDNCEHVATSARTWAERLASLDADIVVLATSRVPLGAAGECVLRIGSLTPPEQISLFCDRAARFRSDFREDQADDETVASICRQLGGLPLALELAARREATFGLEQLDLQLAEGFDVIEPSADRSDGVTATVDWSYRLLDPAAQALFDRLAVCAGGFGLDALAPLAPAGTTNPVHSLAELVDASLVEADVTARPTRYRMPEVMRRVALTHLSADERREATTDHRTWMRRHLERCHRLQCERSPDGILRVRTESANLCAALTIDAADAPDGIAEMAVHAALISCDDPHLEVLDRLRRLERWAEGADEPAALCALASGTAAWIGGETSDASRLLGSALEVLPRTHPLYWAALHSQTANAMFIGDLDEVERRTLEMLDQPDAPLWARATSVCCAALMRQFCADQHRAATWMADHAALLEGAALIDGFVSYTRGELLSVEDPLAALGWFEDAMRRSADARATYFHEVAGIGRASVLVRLGRTDDAAHACADAVAGSARIGMWPQAWTAMRLSAELLVAMGEPAAAATLLTAAARDPLASEVLQLDLVRQNRLWEAIQAELADPDLQAARLLGAQLSRAQAQELALDALAAG